MSIVEKGHIRRIGGSDLALTNGAKEPEPQGVPLKQILGKTVAEFAQFPRGKQPDDFPDKIAYFRSEDTLVMLRRRRPVSYSPIYQPFEGVHDGYFAEVFDMSKDGKPVNGFSNPVSFEGIPEGLFQGIQVTDEPGDPYYGSLWLTPTSFPAIIREKLGEKMSNQPKALPSPGDEKKDVLGQLFAQKELRSVEQMKKEEEGKSIREEIIKKYFHEESTQGLDKEVGNSHFVITGDEKSQLVQVSKKMGVETYIVKPDETWKNANSNAIDRLRDDSGKRPMLLSIDRSSFDSKEIPGLAQPADVAIGQVVNYVGRLGRPNKNPLFSFIEWRKNDASEVSRLREGWYILHGNDPEAAKKLIMKVGIDFLLTFKVRELAKDLG